MEASHVVPTLLVQLEGLELRRYTDVAGIATIGVGHCIRPGESFEDLSPGEALALLDRDVCEFEGEVRKLVDGLTLAQHEFDALILFAFNVGVEALGGSTLLKKLRAGDHQGAADEFPKWSHAGGKEVAGLLRRREVERALFLGGDYAAVLKAG